MNLSGTQLKDTYGNLVTTGTSAGSPTEGGLQNGDGQLLTQVGIGTNSPSHILDIESANSPQLRITDTTNDVAFKVYAQDADVFMGTHSNHALRIATNNDEKLRIEADGDIAFYDDANNQGLFWDASEAFLGIGTVPATPLHVNATNANACIINVTGTSPNYIFDIRDDNVSQFRVDNSGSVGIGTTSPANDVSGLHIAVASSSDQLYLERTSSATGRYYLGTASNSFFIVDDAQSAERLRIDSSGNVGINTDSPSGKLEIYSSTLNNQLYLVSVDTGQSAINFGGTSAKTKGRISYSDNSDLMYFFTDSQERMRIDSSGKVGINCTPVKKLQVTDGVSGDAGNLLLVNTNDTNGDTASLQFSMTDSDSFNKAGIFFERTTTQGRGSLHLANNIENNGNNVTKSDARLTIDSSGNVGIGTTSPSVNLDIEDSSNVLVDINTTTANANTTIRFQEGGTAKATIGYDGTNNGLILTSGGFTAGNGIFIDDSQNVGIGTNSPTSGNRLHIKDSDAQIELEATGSGTSNSGFLDFDGTSLQLSTNRDNKTGTFHDSAKSHASVLLVGSDGGSYIRFNTAAANNTTATERMRILSSGGITFNGDTATANALDDYEEGTHDTAITCGTSGTITLGGSTEKLQYTKIGRLVTVTGRVAVSGVSSPTGNFTMSLPFTIADLDENSGRSTGSIKIFNTSTNVDNFFFTALEGNAFITVFKGGSTNGTSDSADTFSGNETIALSITYVAA
jgi:hypothetical protein